MDQSGTLGLIRDNIVELAQEQVSSSMTFDQLTDITYGGFRGISGLVQSGKSGILPKAENQMLPSATIVGE